MTQTPPKQQQRKWLLEWDQLGTPVWGVGPDGKISFMNKRAEDLLGLKAGESIGRPCSEVIGALDPDSGCGDSCPQLEAARACRPLKPKTIKVTSPDGATRWIQLMPILMTAPDGSGPYVMESAIDIDRWARIEDYVMKIAARELPQDQTTGQELTPREHEILSLLAEDLVQAKIAAQLHISYTTVRTHVQRILAKLGVRSIQAAVARHLLDLPGES